MHNAGAVPDWNESRRLLPWFGCPPRVSSSRIRKDGVGLIVATTWKRNFHVVAFLSISPIVLSKSVANCLISIGTNLGDRSLAIDRAVSALQVNDAITVSKVSNRHITQPVGGPAGQGAFLNAVALLETALAPSVLLSELQAIEVAAGRTREVRWGARSLDLDLLLYGEIVSNDGHLVLPHPRMAFRRFVLEPACEVVRHR